MTRRKQTQLRLPEDLHAELVRRAEEQDVSLNLLLVSLLAGAVGFKLTERCSHQRERQPEGRNTA